MNTIVDDSAAAPGRRGGRKARHRIRTAAPQVSRPTLVRDIPVYEVLDRAGVELIHDASMRILEEVGIDFRDDTAPGQWREAGAEVDGERIRIPRELLMSLVEKTPESYTMRGRNPERTVTVGGRNTVFAPTYGSPYVLDFDDKRRYSTLEDLQQFHRLAYMSPALHVTGGIIVEPVDVAVPKRHLHIGLSLLTNSDKPFMGAVTSRERAEDTVEMAKIAYGADVVDSHTVMTSVCNCNSPLVWDQTMLDAVRVYAGNNQAVLLSPFVMAGANTPASTVGALAQLNAEALAGIAYAQLVRPGAPMVYGNYVATVSMRSGAPMAGTPETCMMNYVIGQLARHYKLPWRSSGMINGSKLVDAQAAYESLMTMHSVLLAGCNYVMHSAGWLEAGLTASFAKFALDVEQIEIFCTYAGGLALDDLEECLDAVREVGPGGHYLGTKHTQDNFESAFFIPDLLDNNSFEQWSAEGGLDTNARGLARAREMLDRYEAPELDAAVEEELRAFVARREAELPDAVT